MASGWRILKARHAASAFSGEGGRHAGGRWHSRGTPVVYLSAHQSLAALEVFVHTQPLSVRQGYVVIEAKWDDALTETWPRDALPPDWRAMPAGVSTAAIGDRWVKEARSVILALPSAIIPAETNYLLNPAHPDVRQVEIGNPIPFVFDQRLLAQ